MKSTLLLSAVALAGLLQAFSAGSPAAKSGTHPAEALMASTSETDKNDTAFAKEAAMGGMAEVALGKMAAEKGMDPRVKDFGRMMVEDHGKANEELKGIARTKNIQLPTKLDDKHQALSDKLAKLSGKEFDEAYVKEMLEDHKKDLKVFQSEADDGTDADLKAFAAKTATMIEHHLTMIEKIHDEMK